MFNNSFRFALLLICVAFGSYQIFKGEFYSGALFLTGSCLIAYGYLRKRAMQMLKRAENKNKSS